MSKKGKRRFGARLKRFFKKPLGKILKVAAIGGGVLATGGLVGKGRLAGAVGGLFKKKGGGGLFGKGLFGRKGEVGKGIGGKLGKKERFKLFGGSLDRLQRKANRVKKKADKEAEKLARRAQDVAADEAKLKSIRGEVAKEMESGEYPESFKSEAKEAFPDVPGIDGDGGSENEAASDNDGGNQPKSGASMGKRIVTGLGIAGTLFGAAKAFGIIK